MASDELSSFGERFDRRSFLLGIAAGMVVSRRVSASIGESTRDAQIAEAMRAGSIPGLAVGVARNGRVLRT
jgi:hypothetical protein